MVHGLRFSVLLLALLPGCASVAPPAPAAIVAEPRTVFENYVAFAEGRIGGEGPYWFLIDTGASRSALDEGLAKELGLELGEATHVQGSAGEIEARAAKLPLLTLGGIEARDLEPTLYDLSGFVAPAGPRFAGILGYDVMMDHAVLFDLPNGRLAFAPCAESFGDLAEAVIVPFALDNNIPRVRAAIDGHPVDLRLDTGASIGPGPTTYVNVTQAFYDRLRAADPELEPYTHFTATGAGGEIRIPVVKAERLELGGLVISEPHLIVQPPAGYFANPDAVGFLGSYALQGRSKFVVDYPGRRLILFR